jgi:hypothetical protein
LLPQPTTDCACADPAVHASTATIMADIAAGTAAGMSDMPAVEPAMLARKRLVVVVVVFICVLSISYGVRRVDAI